MEPKRGPGEEDRNFKAPETGVRKANEMWMEPAKPGQEGVYVKPFNTNRSERAVEVDETFKPVVPRGWTTLFHGTNMTNWETSPSQADEISVTKTLSVIDQRTVDLNRLKGPGYDTTRTYSSGKRVEGMSEEEFQKRNIPFEIRILFYDDLLHYPSEDVDKAASLDQTAKDIIQKYYQSNRHPEVPKGEKLIKLGQTIDSGHEVFYFVPQRIADRYFEEAGLRENAQTT